MSPIDGLPRVLIIDDEPVVLASCTEILRTEGVALATADDGMQGLELVEEFGPDLVLVDLKMPGIPGMEVLETLTDRDPTIVTVVITGYATLDTAIDAMKRGAYDFIPKPFTPDQLRQVTSRALEKRSLLLETIALRREKEVLRENFAAIVSHELKSPLSAVQQNLFVLSSQLADVADEKQLERVDRMKARIGDLVEMVDTWLQGVSSDLNGIRERFESCPISIPITTAVENVESHAVRKNVEVSTSIDEGAEVYGDDGTLAEALTNIIGNAVKYSYEGGKVRVSARGLDGEVRVDVTDEGAGIPAGDLPHVFDDFFRSDAARLSEGGAGLGLAMSRRIVEAHGGSISAVSEVGQGTTVSLMLPSRPTENTRPEPEKSEVQTEAS